MEPTVDDAAGPTPAMPQIDKQTLHTFWLFLLPSWISAAAVIGLFLMLLFGPFVLIHFTLITQDGLSNLSTAYQSSSIFNGAHTASSNILANSLISQSAYVLFWLIVGFIVYLLAVGVAKEIINFISLYKQFDYVHIYRQQLIRNLLVRFTIRILASLLVLIIFLVLVYRLLPYTLTLTNASSASGLMINSWFKAILFCVLSAFVSHMLVLALRLTTLRVRLFSTVSI